MGDMISDLLPGNSAVRDAMGEFHTVTLAPHANREINAENRMEGVEAFLALSSVMKMFDRTTPKRSGRLGLGRYDSLRRIETFDGCGLAAEIDVHRKTREAARFVLTESLFSSDIHHTIAFDPLELTVHGATIHIRPGAARKVIRTHHSAAQSLKLASSIRDRIVGT